MSNRPVRAIPASAPDRLAIVEAFLNTLHVERGTDALADAIGVRAWLAESQFEVKADDLTRADRDRLVRLRAVLRVMRGDRAAAGAVPADDFADVVGTTVLAPRLGDVGQVTLTPVGSGIDAIIGTLVTIVHEAQREGTWDRLKICRNERCRWAFYDESRSRTATWCAMGICGNRAKVAAYRRKQIADRARVAAQHRLSDDQER
ncbi:MAG TPA: CGNR zinc finger domain-containing protein [Streptosporangiaceae bacterium]|nr:CGNR zinc finger domain-containing protein [Streptosporangiaceae bacterium]